MENTEKKVAENVTNEAHGSINESNENILIQGEEDVILNAEDQSSLNAEEECIGCNDYEQSSEDNEEFNEDLTIQG